MEKIKLSEIKVSSAFASTTPNPKKVQRYREYYEENQKQSKPILLDHNNILRDGYIQYLILKENGVEEATIIRKKYKKNKKTQKKTTPLYKKMGTTYIYGIHPNDKSKTERVWRVPVSWKGWEKDLLPGDKILVRTKYGNAPIIITKIEWLNRCPVDVPVKKVVRRLLGDKDA